MQDFTRARSFFVPGCNGTIRLPVGKYMLSINYVGRGPAGHLQFFYGWKPELNVSGDTEVSFDFRQAKPVEVQTPDPTTPTTAIVGFNRVIGDGRTVTSNYWSLSESGAQVLVLPTEGATTVGSFDAFFQVDLNHPLLEMSTVRPHRIKLHPVTDRLAPYLSPAGVLFEGKRRLPLIYAAEGDEDDFAGLNVRGKLVMVRVNPSIPGAQWIATRNALAAGAAGVLLATADGSLAWAYTPDRIPVASLTKSDADTLLSLLRQGPVTIALQGTPVTPYRYTLRFSEKDRVPESLSYRVTKDQLFQANTTYRSEAPGAGNMTLAGLGPNDWFGLAVWYPSVIPSTRTEYVGPGAPDVGWIRDYVANNHAQSMRSYDVFSPGERRDEDWGIPINAPGAMRTSDLSKLESLYFKTYFPFICAGCRERDNFTPFLLLTDGHPHHYSNIADWTQTRVYADGSELPAQPLDWTAYGFPLRTPTFRLPEDNSTILITQGTALPPESGKYGRTINSTWQFKSQRPDPAAKTDKQRCIGADTESCRPEPLIFLGYDLNGLEPDNTTRAGRTFSFDVSAYHQEDVPGEITTLSAQVSFNNGATWKKTPVAALNDGKYRVLVTHPKLAKTSGAVSVRIQAKDSNGASVTQTVLDAYGLT